MSVLFYIKKSYKNLPRDLKVQAFFVVLIMLIMTGIEVFTVSVVAFFVSVLSDYQSVVHSKYFSYLGWSGTTYTQKNMILALSIITTMAVLIKSIVRGFYVYYSSRHVGLQEKFWGARLLQIYISHPYIWHLDQKRSDLIISIVSWRHYIGKNLVSSFLIILSNCFQITGVFILLVIVQPSITIPIICFFSMACLLLFFFSKNTLDKFSLKNREIEKKMGQDISNALYGIKDVKIADSGAFFINRVELLLKKYADNQGRLSLFSESPALILEFLGFFAISIIIVVMTFKQNNSTAMITGTISVIALTAWRVLPAVSSILSAMTKARIAFPFVGKIFSYADEKASQATYYQDDDSETLSFNKMIEFDAVSFSYPGKELLFNSFDLQIPFGASIGIIGASGSGKSTLVDMITGCLTPDQGVIRIDDHVLNSENIKQWTSKIGYVTQFPYIYDGSIAANIAFGIPEERIDFDRLYQCCDMASMDFIKELDSGLQTAIGDGGVKLSGGQRQRIAIARALYRKPELLIFDEATSALDEQTEKEILDTVYSLKGKITIVVISHKKTSVMACNSLVWIDKGKVAMIGDPEAISKKYNEV